MQLVCLYCYILYKENTVDLFLLHFIILMYSLPPLNSLFQVMELWCHSRVLLIFVPENCKKKKKEAWRFFFTPLILDFSGSILHINEQRDNNVCICITAFHSQDFKRCLTAEQQTLRVVVKRTVKCQPDFLGHIVSQSRGRDCTSLASFRLTTWENQKCPTQGRWAAGWLTWDQERR